MTDTIHPELDARRAHDVGDFCDRIWAIALTRTVAGVPPGLSPCGSQAKPLIDYRKEADNE
jgi:hypothetical protein